LRVASSNPNWEAAYLFAVISVNTTAGPKEVASLRIKDIDWERQRINIPAHGAKNSFRIRPIELNAEALAAVKLAVARAQRLGAVDPEHHIFPFRIHRALYDPSRFQTTFKTAWKKVTAAALLGKLQMYDLRRTAITVLLENPEISDETVEEICGHVPGSCTKKRYSYIRVKARKAAVDALLPVKAEPRKRPVKSEKPTKSTEREELVRQFSELLGKLLKTG
jgi:integrase